MVAQFIATWPIINLYLEAVRRPGARVAKWWWYQKELLFVLSHSN